MDWSSVNSSYTRGLPINCSLYSASVNDSILTITLDYAFNASDYTVGSVSIDGTLYPIGIMGLLKIIAMYKQSYYYLSFAIVNTTNANYRTWLPQASNVLISGTQSGTLSFNFTNLIDTDAADYTELSNKSKMYNKEYKSCSLQPIIIALPTATSSSSTSGYICGIGPSFSLSDLSSNDKYTSGTVTIRVETIGTKKYFWVYELSLYNKVSDANYKELSITLFNPNTTGYPSYTGQSVGTGYLNFNKEKYSERTQSQIVSSLGSGSTTYIQTYSGSIVTTSISTSSIGYEQEVYIQFYVHTKTGTTDYYETTNGIIVTPSSTASGTDILYVFYLGTQQWRH